MTQNLYVGPPLNDAFAASSWEELVAAGSQAWANLLASDFPTRAGALADEIAEARPDVVGLQEVTLWRDQTPSDVMTQPTPNATDVAFDFLAILQGELSARGVPYTPVATSTNVDVEFPRLDPEAGLVDVRLTDRDVLMVRADLADRFSNPGNGHYTAQFSEPFPTGPVTSTRGWTSIDYRPDPGDHGAGVQHPPRGGRPGHRHDSGTAGGRVPGDPRRESPPGDRARRLQLAGRRFVHAHLPEPDGGAPRRVDLGATGRPRLDVLPGPHRSPIRSGASSRASTSCSPPRTGL